MRHSSPPFHMTPHAGQGPNSPMAGGFADFFVAPQMGRNATETYGYAPTYRDAVRMVVPGFADLSDAVLDDELADLLATFSPEEVESFWTTVQSLGRTVAGVGAQVMPTVGQIAGGIAGGIVGGGPIGASIGSMVGSAAGQMAAQGLGSLAASGQHPPEQQGNRSRVRIRPRPAQQAQHYMAQVGHHASQVGQAVGGLVTSQATLGVNQLNAILSLPQVQQAIAQAAAGGTAQIANAAGQALSAQEVMVSVMNELSRISENYSRTLDHEALDIDSQGFADWLAAGAY